MTGPPEDWFPQAEAPRSQPDHVQSSDDWLVEEDLLQRSTFEFGSIANRLILVPATVVVVFFIAVLAAFGVFNSGPAAIPPITSGSPSVSTQAAPPTTQPATTTTPRIVAPTITLKPGDIGPAVKALQQELESLGYHVGALDGSYGTSTAQAVAAFQRAHSLTADGVVGPKTLEALAP